MNLQVLVDLGFEPIPAEVIPNPDMSGINTSATVFHMNKPEGAQWWAGMVMNLGAPIDFSTETAIEIKVWSPRAGVPISLKIEDQSSPPDANGDPSVAAEVQAITTVANEWET